MGVLAISLEEREEIVRMRKAGVAVKEISRLTERSTHSIYRIIKKANETQQNITTTKKKTSSNTETQSEPLSDSSETLLCAVDSLEVSALEPIPIPMSMQQLPMQPQLSHPGIVDANVGFAAAPVATSTAKSCGNDTSVGFWLLQDAVSTPTSQAPCAAAHIAGCNQVQPLQIQPSKKQKTSTSQSSCHSVDGRVLPVSGLMESTADSPIIRAAPSAGATTQSRPSKRQKTSTSQGSSLVTRCPPSSNPTCSELAITQSTASSATRNYNSDDGFDELLKRIQDEIRRLEGLAQSDIYDAQLLQMLVKFRAELRLVQMQKTHRNVVEVSCKPVTGEGSGDAETSSLLRQRLVKEIALLDVQVDRERLELERERIKHKTTSILCRKRLLDAHASPADVDKLLPRQ